LADPSPWKDQNMTTQPHHVAAMVVYAIDLAHAYPAAQPAALADKLLTVWTDTPRETRLDVAAKAIFAVRVQQAA
jgi:hypothetical protein